MMVLISTFHLAVTILPENVRGATLYVGGTGPGNFTTIQGAIDAANSGDVVFVYSRTYMENIVVNKTLTIIGESYYQTAIYGRQRWSTVNVTADWVNITHLTVLKGGFLSNESGILLYGVQNCHIYDTRIYNNRYSGLLLNSSHNNTVEDNYVVVNDVNGIHLVDSSNNTIYGNRVDANDKKNIYLERSDNNTIVQNSVSGGYDGIYLSDSNFTQIIENAVAVDTTAIEIVRSDNNTIYGNTIPDQLTRNGVRLSESHNNSIMQNEVTNTSAVGIHTRQSSRNEVAENFISYNTGTGVSLGYESKYNRIYNNTVSWNDGHGISMEYAFNNTISNNTVTGNAGTGLLIMWWATGNVITGNTLSNNEYGVWLRRSDKNYIMENQMNWNTLGGAYVAQSDWNVVDNNSANSNGYSGLIFYDSENNTIENNEFSSNLYDGVTLGMSVGNLFRNNTMTSDGVFIHGNEVDHWTNNDIDSSNLVNGKQIVYWKNATGGTVPLGGGQVILANCTDVTVSNQAISDTSVGILLGFTRNSTIVDNVLSLNKRAGAYLSSSINTTVKNNVAFDNRAGINISTFSSFNNVSDNDLYSNEIGISIYYSEWNTVVNNTVRQGFYGFFTLDSGPHRIFHNRVIDNSIQAWSQGWGSWWYSGYPAGGNYWSDYSGTDNMHGPDQNLPGSDGIGDLPYWFLGSYDRYPLMAPYQSIHPLPPTDLHSSLTGDNSENVTLAWSLSLDDGTLFQSIVSYHVLRGTVYDIGGLGYNLIATLPNGTTQFVDALAGEGDPNNYFYLVCAVDLNSNTNCTTDQAVKFTRHLPQGMNLVSIPALLQNESINSVFQTLKWNSTWTFDSLFQKWRHLLKSKSHMSEITSINMASGFWVDVAEDSNLTVAGLMPTSWRIDLRKGWNLVGFPSFSMTYSVGDLKVDAGAKTVEGFDPSSYPYFLREMLDGDSLQSGYAYWILMDYTNAWHVPGS